MARFLIGMGSGRCGTQSLAYLLNLQPRTQICHECLPLLPYTTNPSPEFVQRRFERLLQMSDKRRSPNDPDTEVVGDVASFYVCYVEKMLRTTPDLRVICLKRSREQVVDSFGRWIDSNRNYLADHWSRLLRADHFRDPVWSTIFPKFDAPSRSEAIGKYWDWYYAAVDKLRTQFPERVRCYATETLLNCRQEQSTMLQFAGYCLEEIVTIEKAHGNRVVSPNRAPTPLSTEELDKLGSKLMPIERNRCAVIVTNATNSGEGNSPQFEELKELGYSVRFIGGSTGNTAKLADDFSDQASQAMLAGFYSTYWLDSTQPWSLEELEDIRRSNPYLRSPLLFSVGESRLANDSPSRNLSVHRTWVHRRVFEHLQFACGLELLQDDSGHSVVPYFQDPGSISTCPATNSSPKVGYFLKSAITATANIASHLPMKTIDAPHTNAKDPKKTEINSTNPS
ncbi:MAG: sulfotransferase [Planctomycetota bacterium]